MPRPRAEVSTYTERSTTPEYRHRPETGDATDTVLAPPPRANQRSWSLRRNPAGRLLRTSDRPNTVWTIASCRQPRSLRAT